MGYQSDDTVDRFSSKIRYSEIGLGKGRPRIATQGRRTSIEIRVGSLSFRGLVALWWASALRCHQCIEWQVWKPGRFIGISVGVRYIFIKVKKHRHGAMWSDVDMSVCSSELLLPYQNGARGLCELT